MRRVFVGSTPSHHKRSGNQIAGPSDELWKMPLRSLALYDAKRGGRNNWKWHGHGQGPGQTQGQGPGIEKHAVSS
jgi:hypothetical protein